ncbi:hypothetical protein B6U99_07020 [Candidatus Geothermarchaeota archaeon ex4572_27]|nr:MAG: hypothetical protein B6U99_07020 [Candidatus Geothermarchaeota archaeon ex4572_27]
MLASSAGANSLLIASITGFFGALAIVASVGLFHDARWSRTLSIVVLALSIAFNIIFAAIAMASSPSPLAGIAGALNGMATAFAAWLVLMSGAWAFK